MTLTAARLKKLAASSASSERRYGGVTKLPAIPFGPRLSIEQFRLENGLSVLVVVDPSAPVVAYQTWFRVGSRHEKPGKTGLAHLFEHLMFNEIDGAPTGAFDLTMESIGAENNASTWLDFTQYQETFPKAGLETVVRLEAARMSRLVLKKPQVESEKEVVANERRYRVDDDVEGTADEVLWATAFERHTYHHPTIGSMQDIQAFSTEDCEAFYRTYYSPNNATVVVVGDVKPSRLLSLLADAYGHLPPAELPLEDVLPEAPQSSERRVDLTLPTASVKVTLGYKCPALGDVDHPPLSLLADILGGGRASRLFGRLVRDDELASDVRVQVGPHRDPSLFEVFAAAREGRTADQLIAAIDEELERLVHEPPSPDELERTIARTELSLYSGLETADGKASSIGFYATVLDRPAAAFEKLEQLRAVTRSDLLRVARRYLVKDSRTVVTTIPREQSGADA